MSENILELHNLKKHFPTTAGGVFNRQKGVVKAVDGVSLTIAAGETVGLVGESGCGKTTAGRTVMKLYDQLMERSSLKVKTSPITHARR